MDGISLDITQDIIQKLKEIVPQAFSEDKLDMQNLQRLLGNYVSNETERYNLSWAGKSEAYKVLQTPTTATLIPNPESSIDWDNAQNVFIEGENLEVLKVLQKSYYGKIKMIYIDPPYNTGSDSFIYPDKFSETKEEYLRRIGDKDEEGYMTKQGLYHKNNKENGQFHSNWLNMMLPRLFLARNLLKDNGVIFVSIDDNEQANLKMLMDEIFGEENFIACMIRENKAGAGHDSGLIAIEYDYILMYSKNKAQTALNKKIIDVENDSKYKNKDEYFEERGKYYLRDLDYRGTYSESGDYEIILPNGKGIFAGGKLGSPNTWRWSKDKVEWGINNGFIVFDEVKEKVYIKQYQYVDNEGNKYERKIPYRALTKFMNGKGSQEVDNLLGVGMFSFPKSTEMIKYLINIVCSSKDDIILDFFAGSGTTAHAVLEQNEIDKGERRFICVQLPEKTEENSEAYKAGYKTIAELAIKRVKNAIEGIKNNRNGKLQFDKLPNIGFRKYTLANSNFKIWRGDVIENEEDLKKQMQLFITPQRENAKNENILWELLIKNGVYLTEKIECFKVSDDTNIYYTVDKKFAFVLDSFTTLILEKILEIKPKSVICLDSLFIHNDSLKTNIELKLKDNNITFKSI